MGSCWKCLLAQCFCMELKPTIPPTNLYFTQVAVIAASCCVGHICMVGGGGGCSCMLLLHPIPTSADGGPNRCTIYTSCSLDLGLVVFPFFQLVQTFHLHRWWLSPVATCCFFIQPLAHRSSTCTRGMVESASATCAGGAFSSSHW